ncbi:MAG TPA: transglycosylase SLT domain-containing protein [Candidatus Binatia bacterium]|nr:transglycosylase SLT domain-containing protein [Candidatus Binatia bacterium]
MRQIRSFLAALLFASVAAGVAGAEARRSDEFPRPASLEPQIRFWRAIFTDYSKHQIVLHDTVDLDKVYKVLDFRDEADAGMSPVVLERLEREETDAELDRLRATFRRLQAAGENPEGLSVEDRRIWALFRDDPAPDRFLAAAADNRLRSQRGLRERFAEGLRVGRRLFPDMERLFRARGLPVELTRLPLIESCFDLHAYSKVGAAGIWQFMPATARRYDMRIGPKVDQRRDPIASTRAAARFLEAMHDALGTWPLAITGWNHGPEGVARAVRVLGTDDLGAIVRDYHGSGFGFASRNFYAEFLAALDVERHARAYFPELPERGAPDVEQASAEPPGAGSDAEQEAEELARVTPVVARVRHRPRRAQPAYLTHRVRSGQTLSHIAKRYKVSVASLRSTNGLGRRSRLRPGQVLKIPRSA